MTLCHWEYIEFGKKMINMMNPNFNKTLIDVACGTGDIGKLFLDQYKHKFKSYMC